MSHEASEQALFGTLQRSLQAAVEAVPPNTEILSPEHGISLLDVKNEMLLSYLHNLVFLILLKIRHRTSATSSGKGSATVLSDQVVKKLVELRVYLEKGVKPLEGRFRYQVDKVLRAADDAERKESSKPVRSSSTKHSRASNGSRHGEDQDDDRDSASSVTSEEIDELSYRPNPAAMMLPNSAAKPTADRGSEKTGLYRPPRIAATAMPTLHDRERNEPRRPNKSAVIDEYIATEMSSAPTAEPSIGSTIVSGGRRMKSERERKEEAERRDYEETNFVRLPKESKKERAKKGVRSRGGFGGEEWRNIDAGVDRIDRLTQKRGGGGKLASSRKRAISDGPRDSGMQAGDRFDKRRRLDMKKGRR